MLEQQNRPFFHSLMCRCKTPAAFLAGLYLGWFTFPLQSHGKHIVPPSPPIWRTGEVRNHLVCGITTSVAADTNPTPSSLPSGASLRCLPLLPTPNEELGGSRCVPHLAIAVRAGGSDPVPCRQILQQMRDLLSF